MFGNKCQILLAAVPRFISISRQSHVILSHMQHTNPSPHLRFEGWCGATPRVLINRRAVLSRRRSMDHPTTVTLTPAVGTLSSLVLFVFLYSDMRASGTYLWFTAVHTHTQRVLDSVMRSICIVCVAYNMIFSVLFEKVYILTAYISGKYRHHLL
jgi:hypothetical protein